MIHNLPNLSDDSPENYDEALLANIPDWEQWLEQRMKEYYQFNRSWGDQSQFYLACERQRIKEIYEEVMTKVLQQMDLFPDKDISYLFSAACYHLLQKDTQPQRSFPYLLAAHEARYKHVQLRRSIRMKVRDIL